MPAWISIRVYCVSGPGRKECTVRFKSVHAGLKDEIIALKTWWLISTWDCIFTASGTRVCLWKLHVGLRLGLVGLLLHDVQDHPAGRRASLGCWMDGDGFFCCACIFLPVDVHPEGRMWKSDGSQIYVNLTWINWLCSLFLG